ncbi:InlB B-repeat-containing protein [Mycoplasmatota bacterium WC44]
MKPLKYLLVILISTLMLTNNIEVSAEGPYTVEFRVWDMNSERYKTIRTQTVSHGDPAIYFEPTLVHYKFVKWDKSIVNVTEDMVVTAIYEPKDYTVTFVDFDETILSKELIPYGTTIEPIVDPVREDYNFIGWSSNDFLISGNTIYTAMYQLIEDEVVIEVPTENPDEPTDKFIKFELDDLEITFGELLEVEVLNETLIKKVTEVINFLDDYEIRFPILKKTEYDGVKVTTYKDSLKEAEGNGVTLYINLDEVTLTLDSEDLHSILIDEPETLYLESKFSNIDMLNIYKIGKMDGNPVDRAFEINLISDDQDAFFTDIEVEYKPKLTDGLFSGHNPENVKFVIYNDEDGSYKTLTSNYDSENQVYNFSIDKNSIIIPMELSERVVELPETFDPIEYILNIDRNILYLSGIGLFLLMYTAVYVAEVLKERKY